MIPQFPLDPRTPKFGSVVGDWIVLDSVAPSPVLDLPWVERSSLEPTEKATRPGPPRGYRLMRRASRWALGAAPAALGLLLVLVLTHGGHESHVVSEVSQGVPQEEEKPDAGARGIGVEALSSAVPALSGDVSLPVRGISRDMPDHPLKGQKRPPCDKRRELVVINGGCWFPVGGKKPPCETHEYDYEGRCYTPLILPEGEPISDEP